MPAAKTTMHPGRWLVPELSYARNLGLAFCLAVGSTLVRSADLPDGEGREAVEATCTACHPVKRAIFATTRCATPYRGPAAGVWPARADAKA